MFINLGEHLTTRGDHLQLKQKCALTKCNFTRPLVLVKLVGKGE